MGAANILDYSLRLFAKILATFVVNLNTEHTNISQRSTKAYHFNSMSGKKHYGLIGYPLSHSFSKKYFTEKFDKEKIAGSVYSVFPLENISDLTKLLKDNPDLCGLNITVPHKIDVMKYLNWISPDAKAAGAVNCIRISAESPVPAAFSDELSIRGHNVRLEGFNTDIYGFELSLKPLLMASHNHALVLGDGGAAKAVKCVLDNLGISYRVVTRKPDKNNILFQDLTPSHIKENLLIINTTPLGTYPNIHEYPPIPYYALTDRHLLYDLVYNPEKTVFLKKGEQQGAVIKNGYEMLLLQAEKSYEIWTSGGKNL